MKSRIVPKLFFNIMFSLQAKRAENRFRVRQVTKFYRVKCRTVDRERERGTR